MRKKLNGKRKVILALSGLVFCSSLTLSDAIRVNANGIQEYGYQIRNENCGDTNALLKIGAKSDTVYGEVFSDTIKTKDKNIPIKILLNPKLCTDGFIQIENQKIPIKREFVETVGYAHAEVVTYDFTGDGKEEIALVLSGGASGAMQAVQVFNHKNGKWSEIATPSDIYSNVPEFLKEQENNLNIKIDESLYYYRTISFEKEKIVITYHIREDSDTLKITEVHKELQYSSGKKKFVLGDTLLTPAAKKCKITTTANKKAITIKWSSEEEKSSIKGVQIKVATRENMKGAKTYKFGKKKAQKMSYQFTVKSGKIAKNKTYYFKVRLKTENQWTKWSGVKKAEIKKK